MRKNALYKYGGVPKAQGGVQLSNANTVVKTDYTFDADTKQVYEIQTLEDGKVRITDMVTGDFVIKADSNHPKVQIILNASPLYGGKKNAEKLATGFQESFDGTDEEYLEQQGQDQLPQEEIEDSGIAVAPIDPNDAPTPSPESHPLDQIRAAIYMYKNLPEGVTKESIDYALADIISKNYKLLSDEFNGDMSKIFDMLPKGRRDLVFNNLDQTVINEQLVNPNNAPLINDENREEVLNAITESPTESPSSNPIEWDKLTPEQQEQVILDNYQPSNTFVPEYPTPGLVPNQMPGGVPELESPYPGLVVGNRLGGPEPAPDAFVDPNANWLRQTANFERNFGKADGTGLSQYTDDYTINRFNTIELPTLRKMIPGYDQLPENQRAQIGDYLLNTGRDPRVMLMYSDELITPEERKKLHNGELNVDEYWNKNKDKITYDPDNIYEAKDEVYRSTKDEGQVDNPMYDNTWRARVEMFSDPYYMERQVDPVKYPNLVYDPDDKSTRYDDWEHDFYGYKPVRNAVLDAGANRQKQWNKHTEQWEDVPEITEQWEDVPELKKQAEEYMKGNDPEIVELEDENDVVNKEDLADPVTQEPIRTLNVPQSRGRELIPGGSRVYRSYNTNPIDHSYDIPSYYRNQPQVQDQQVPQNQQIVQYQNQNQPAQQIINTGRNLLNKAGQGVKKVIGKAKGKVKQIKANRKARKDAEREKFEGEYDRIDFNKEQRGDMNEEYRDLRKSQRLDNRGRRGDIRSTKSRNRLFNEQELQPLREIMREDDLERNKQIQDMKAQKRFLKEQKKIQRKDARKRAEDERKVNKLQKRINKLSEKDDHEVPSIDPIYNFKSGGELLTDDDFDYAMDVSEDQFRMLNGSKLPKAQNSLDLDNKDETESFFNPSGLLNQNSLGYNRPGLTDRNFRKEFDPFMAKADAMGSVTLGRPMNVPQYNLDYEMPYSSKYSNLSEDNILAKYDVETDRTPKSSKNKSDSPYGDYDPTKLSEYSNILQHQAQGVPIAYDTMMGLKPIKDPKMFYTKKNFKKQTVTPNYLAIDSAMSNINDQVREGSRSPQAMMANMINARMSGAKQKSELANKIQQQNLQLEQQYLSQVNQEKDKLDGRRDKRERQREANLVTRQQSQKEAVNNISQRLIDKGLMLGQEKSDRIRLNNYLNEIASDYEYKIDKNGMPYVVHKGNGTAMSMPQYEKMLEDQVTKNATTAHSDAADPNAKVKVDSETGKVSTESNKYGGWVGNKKRYKRVRNRLY